MFDFRKQFGVDFLTSRLAKVESNSRSWFRWSHLSRIGSSRIVGTSWIWLIVVPVGVRILGPVYGTKLDLGQHVDGLKFHVELPFSWQVLFFSALSFTIARQIYDRMCPLIIKENQTFGDFERAGRDYTWMDDYIEQLRNIGAPIELIPNVSATRTLKGRYVIQRMADNQGGCVLKFFPGQEDELLHPMPSQVDSKGFWLVFRFADELRLVFRYSCAAFYYVGMALALVVFVQNIWFALSRILGIPA